MNFQKTLDGDFFLCYTEKKRRRVDDETKRLGLYRQILYEKV